MEHLQNVWDNITVEPVVVMYCLIIALSSIPGEELYLKKACTVNLNHSMEICNNIYEHEETQIETQKMVSGIQVEIYFFQISFYIISISSHLVPYSRVFQA